MAVTKTFVTFALFCAVLNILPTESVGVIDRITGFIKSEAEYVREKMQDVAHAVHELVHPDKNPVAVKQPNYGHHPHTDSLPPPTSENATKQESGAPREVSTLDLPTVGDNSNSNLNLNESSTNDESTDSYDIDVRNNEDDANGNGTEFAVFQSILAYKGCPEGQRKDRAGKCRSVN